jgi:hypothetical protein
MIDGLRDEGMLNDRAYNNLSGANTWIEDHNALTYFGETTRQQRGEDFMSLPGKAFDAVKTIGSDPEKRKALGNTVTTAVNYYKAQTQSVPSTDNYAKRRKIDYDSSSVPYGMSNRLALGPSEDYPRGEIVEVD